MIELAVLDIAGTTVDEGGAVYDALRSAVVDDELNAGTALADASIQRWMGVEKRAAMRELTLVASGREADGEAVERMYAHFRRLLQAAYVDSPPVPFAGVEDAFSELRARGVKVALTTGFSRDIALPLLDGLGWTVGADATVDALVCGDEVGAGRPAPFLVFRAMERTGVRSVDRVVVVGDTAVDLRAGSNAGATAVVGVATGGLDHRQLGVERHTHLLDSVAQLPLLVDAIT